MPKINFTQLSNKDKTKSIPIEMLNLFVETIYLSPGWGDIFVKNKYYTFRFYLFQETLRKILPFKFDFRKIIPYFIEKATGDFNFKIRKTAGTIIFEFVNIEVCKTKHNIC